MKNSKIQKFIGVLIIVLYVVFVGKNVFPLINDETLGVTKLQTAIEEVDTKYLATHLEIEGQNISLKADELEDIAMLLLDSGYLYELGYDDYNDMSSNIYVKKDGKEKFFLDKYVLVLSPYNLLLESDTPGAKVFINGKEIGEIDDEYMLEYGPILPGKHTIELKYDGDYIELEEEDEVIFLDKYESTIYHSIYLDGDYVWIDSDYPEADLLINGKDSGKTIEELDYLGPVPLDGSIVLQAKLDIGEEILESEEVIVDDDYIYLEFVDDIEEPYDFYEEELFLEDALYELIDSYEHDMVSAINFNDFYLVDMYIQDDSPLYKSQKNLVESLNEKGFSEELLDYEIIDFDTVADDELDVEVYESHIIIDSDGNQEMVEHIWIYTVIIVDDRLLLYDLR
ncbi:MAG TPA: hypothetical protein GX392_03505 [Clostridiales bacterium]|nr:hypothetical protein [Clostridiales bacterium]